MLKKRYLWFALAAVAATSFACGDSGSSGEQDGECKVKEDCPEGQICNADNKCEANVECTEATQEEDCPAGQICKDGKCDVKPECVESKDCEENFECVSNKCKPLPECTEEGDCVAKYGDHYICTSGTCEVDPNYKEVTEADVAISLKEADALEVSEDGTTAQFYVVLDRDPLLPVSLKIASSNTDEGTVSPSTLSFDSSNWDKPQPVTVTGVDDNVIDGDQKFDVTVTYNKISETGESVVGEQKTVSVTNKDNDVAGVVLNGAENLVTTEDKESATFTLTLTVKPESAVTLKLSSDNPAEGTVEPAEITIDPAKAQFTTATDLILSIDPIFTF
ncbi:MAG: hypothetical protein IJU23_04900, partial [Proteobacteria bacterium]|nr:hypothetical protein [Pseudomonadota bacterium]